MPGTIKENIRRFVLKELLFLAVLALVIYLLVRLLLQNVPVVLPRYNLEFAGGKKYAVVIAPRILNDHDYNRLLRECYSPSDSLVNERIKEFIVLNKIKEPLIKKVYVNEAQVRFSKVYSDVLSRTFIYKLVISYLFFVIIRFVMAIIRLIKAHRKARNQV